MTKHSKVLHSRPPLERMLRIHELLQSGKTPTCRELAERLEVSGKTIQRDLEFMRDRLKLPAGYSKRHGGYRYSESVSGFPSVQVTEGEVVALLVAQRALEQYRGTRFEATLRSAFEKISSSLSDQVVFQPDLEVSFRPASYSAHDLEVFELLYHGVREQREATFGYLKLKSEAHEPRRVRPHHLACIHGQWYLVAWDTQREAMRTFALTRISSPKLTDRKFQRVQGFDIGKYFGNSFGVFTGEGATEVRIRFDAFAARLVRERLWHPSQVIRALPKGEIELTLYVSDHNEVASWVLGWGEHAVALEPPELMVRMRRSLATAARNYSEVGRP